MGSSRCTWTNTNSPACLRNHQINVWAWPWSTNCWQQTLRTPKTIWSPCERGWKTRTVGSVRRNHNTTIISSWTVACTMSPASGRFETRILRVLWSLERSWVLRTMLGALSRPPQLRGKPENPELHRSSNMELFGAAGEELQWATGKPPRTDLGLTINMEVTARKRHKMIQNVHRTSMKTSHLHSLLGEKRSESGSNYGHVMCSGPWLGLGQVMVGKYVDQITTGLGNPPNHPSPEVIWKPLRAWTEGKRW